MPRRLYISACYTFGLVLGNFEYESELLKTVPIDNWKRCRLSGICNRFPPSFLSQFSARWHVKRGKERGEDHPPPRRTAPDRLWKSEFARSPHGGHDYSHVPRKTTYYTYYFIFFQQWFHNYETARYLITNRLVKELKNVYLFHFLTAKRKQILKLAEFLYDYNTH